MCSCDNCGPLSIFIGIVTTLSFVLETHLTVHEILFNKIAKKTKKVDGDVFPDKDYGLVYFKTNYTRFNTISDEDFKVSEKCGELHRNVQYCQWHEVPIAHTIDNGSYSETYYTYTYYKGWENSPINSDFFHSIRYTNPRIDLIPETTKRQPIQAGSYMLDSTIELHGGRIRFSPQKHQILKFVESDMGMTFEYVEGGIFYRSYKKGPITNLLEIPSFLDTTNTDMIDWCTPGDTRVWFTYWAPPQVTVIGEKNGNIISYKEIDGHKIGAAHSDDMSLKDMVGINVSSFPVDMMWILRIIFVGIVIFQIKFIGDDATLGTFFMGIFLFCITNFKWFCKKIDGWFIKSCLSLLAGFIMAFINSGNRRYKY